MSEDKEVKQWKEKLFYRPKNGYDQIDAEQTGEIFAYAEGYKRFLDAARTEREAVKEAIRMAEDAGFVPYTFGMELQPGSKVYVNNRDKALMLAVLGEQPLDHGCVIAGAHVDSPRLDLKQTPMYEDSITAASRSTSGSRSRWSCTARSRSRTAARSTSPSVASLMSRSLSSPTCCRTSARISCARPWKRASPARRSTSSSAACRMPVRAATV